MSDKAILVRQAICREDYAGALELWNALAVDCRAAIDRGDMTAETMHEFRELYLWSSFVLRAARCHLGSLCSRARSAGAYLPHCAPSGTFRASL
jgi:hypothetical protein